MEPVLENPVSMLKRWLGPSAGETPSLFAASATILSLASIYLYFAGYIFAFFYYGYGFGVTLESLDLSTQYYFMQSYKGLATPIGVLLIAAVIVAVVAYISGRVNRGVMLLVLIGTFPALLAVSGRHEAVKREVAERCHPGLPAIRLHFKTSTASKADAAGAVASDMANEALAKAGEDGKLFLLLETKDRIVFFEVGDCSVLGDKNPPSLDVYTVLRADLEFSMLNQT